MGPLISLLSSDMLASYKGKIEQISTCTCDYLDMLLSKQSIGGGLASILFEPVFRSKGPILSHGSQHPLRIHMDWPIAYMKTVWMRSSRLSDFHIAKEAFLRRLRGSYVTESFVCMLTEPLRAFKHVMLSSNLVGLIRIKCGSRSASIPVDSIVPSLINC